LKNEELKGDGIMKPMNHYVAFLSLSEVFCFLEETIDFLNAHGFLEASQELAKVFKTIRQAALSQARNN